MRAVFHPSQGLAVLVLDAIPTLFFHPKTKKINASLTGKKLMCQVPSGQLGEPRGEYSRLPISTAGTGTSSEDIHAATPGAAVEGSEVRPNRSRIEGAVFHARRQDSGGSNFPFNEADRSS
ncbi:MAG: hypothetical protein M3Y72_22585 [Acidobacteriota bacterium]|nr:hypothetical protein [Acidobacteriota bacterium]MDQ2843774.1 hypothetical protein [Acidobacteriota bacterium]